MQYTHRSFLSFKMNDSNSSLKNESLKSDNLEQNEEELDEDNPENEYKRKKRKCPIMDASYVALYPSGESTETMRRVNSDFTRKAVTELDKNIGMSAELASGEDFLRNILKPSYPSETEMNRKAATSFPRIANSREISKRSLDEFQQVKTTCEIVGQAEASGSEEGNLVDN